VACLQRQTNKVLPWIEKWRLRLNVSKTTSIVFGTKSDSNINKNGEKIDRSSSACYLGITLDRKLSMNTQVNQLKGLKSKGARAALYPILNRGCPIPVSAKLAIYKIHVKRIIFYAVTARGPLISESNWKRIEAVQNIAVRTITGAHCLTNNTNLLASVSVQTSRENAKRSSSATFPSSVRLKMRELGMSGDPFELSKINRPIAFTKQDDEQGEHCAIPSLNTRRSGSHFLSRPLAAVQNEAKVCAWSGRARCGRRIVIYYRVRSTVQHRFVPVHTIVMITSGIR